MGQTTGSERSPEIVSAGRPPLVVAAVCLAVQGLAAIGYCVLVLVTMERVAAGVAVGVIGLGALWGLGLLAVARGIVLARYWARAPAVAAQLLLFPLAFGFTGTFGWLAAVLFLSLAVILVCLFLPTSNHIFTAGRRLPGQAPGEH